MRLTVVVSNVRGGGSTLAAVTWANGWALRGHRVSILAILPDEGDGPDFPVREEIALTRIDLSDRPARNRFQAGARLLRNLLRLRLAVQRTRPEVVVAFDGPINTRTLLACLGLRAPVVVMEQTHPGQYHFGRFWERCRELVYPRAAALVNLTHAAAEWSAGHFRARRLAVIPNPVAPARAQADLRRGGPWTVVAAGRLVEQKRFDLLIRAFAKIAPRHPDWSLVIHGEGGLRPDLERLVEDSGLRGRVRLPGWTADLSAELAKGDLFALSSGYEGFGNVIAEALVAGLPVVSFDCPSGPAEIIRHEVDGLLVPPLDVDALAAALGRLMGDQDLRLRMGARAPEALERFSLESTLARWDDLLAQVRPRAAKTAGTGERGA